jgi:ATP-dependent DNA ligase
LAVKTFDLCPFLERRRAWKRWLSEHDHPRLDLSPMLAFDDWDALADARADPAGHGAGGDADAVEGVMIKRADSAYVPGRPKGPWWKWKRDPMLIDAVLMYAQRGHGKRSSLYSDYTFGVWKEDGEGRMLVPVGKAYFGFTDAELKQIDSFRAQAHRQPVRPGARGDPWRRCRHGVRGGVRRPATLNAAQERDCHALSAHLTAALGQAAP